MRVLPDGSIEEDLTSQINGILTDFTLSKNALVHTVCLFVNGVHQGLPGGAFSMVDPVTVRFTPYVLTPPDELLVQYQPR